MTSRDYRLVQGGIRGSSVLKEEADMLEHGDLYGMSTRISKLIGLNMDICMVCGGRV